MTSELAVVPDARELVLSEDTKETLEGHWAKNTEKAYRASWALFQAWCSEQGVTSFPATPVTVANYLVALSRPPRAGSVLDPASQAATAGKPARSFARNKNGSRTVSTITRHSYAIQKMHQLGTALTAEGCPPTPVEHPLVKETLTSLRRTYGTVPLEKNALLLQGLARCLAAAPVDLRGARDTALLLVGFFGAFRRAELCDLHVAHVTKEEQGIVLFLPRSKTDTEGAGRHVALAARDDDYCPVHALSFWLEVSGITEGPLFRGIRHGVLLDTALRPTAYVRRLKILAKRAGLKPKDLAGHSLRAGFVTAALEAGARPDQVMKVTGHKRMDTLQRYLRVADRWKDPASAKIKLAKSPTPR